MRPRRHRPNRAASQSFAWIAGALGVCAVGYLGLVARAYLTFGNTHPADPTDDDPLLDAVLPEFDQVERHHVAIAAPAALAFKVALQTDFQSSPVIQTIIQAREAMLGDWATRRTGPHGLLAEVQALGWRIVAEGFPGREIVAGAVTQPWFAAVVFRGMSAAELRAFAEPDYVKIAWTLRVDPVDPSHCILRTETRIQTTDRATRERFRRYWAKFSPGIILIRWVLLDQVRREAERQTRLH